MLEYSTDILGKGFEKCTIPLDNDSEGEVIATLIRCKAEESTKSALLYVHGFNDYFFQKELALWFNDQAFNFYAIDLRRYGRSYLPHQKFNDIRNLRSYYEEILKAIEIIHHEENEKVVLMGHSTGGLILTLFAKDYLGRKVFDGLILNSPFYDFNLPPLLKFLIPTASLLGRFFPSIRIQGGFTDEYGKSIHKDYYGEWDYDLKWKPNKAPAIHLGWIRAIHLGQKELRKPFDIQQPVLLLHSTSSVKNTRDPQEMLSSDAILDVNQMDKIARNIHGYVDIVSINGGLHDLILSPKPVRDHVYSTMLTWMTKKI